ncbi:MAG: hypothetical protein ACREP9_01765 [Candidatus Dormibacteraceae bacterium]
MPIPRTPKRTFHQLKSDVVEEVIAGYAEGLPIVELAARSGIHPWTVHKYVRLSKVRRRSLRLGPKETVEAAELYAKGQSLATVGKHFGVGGDAVARAFARAGVTVRPRQGWKY